MRNKKIWIGLICAFFVVCTVCLIQAAYENNQKTVISKDNIISKTDDILNSDSEIKNKTDESLASIDATENEDIKNVDNENENKNPQVLEEQNKPIPNELNTEKENNPDDKSSQDNLQENTFSIDEKTGMDKYNTLPVPEGKPVPVEWQDVKVNKDKELKCNLSVSCETILNNKDKLISDKKDIVPEDGIIFPSTEVVFYEGESVFNVLLREMKKGKIHMEFVMTPLYNSNYIEGIANLYEFDCGELSGWIYKVNGWVPNYGSSRYSLKDGDIIEWVYTCDLGRDVGAEFIEPAEPKKTE